MNIKFSASGLICSDPHFSNERFFCWTRGYFIAENKMMWGAEMCQWFVNAIDQQLPSTLIPDLSGVFQLTVFDSVANKFIIVQDRWGSYPVFYAIVKNEIHISDGHAYFLEKSKYNIGQQAAAELITFGHVMGNKTLIDGIDELIPHHWAECLINNDGSISLQQHDYWNFHLGFKTADFNKSSKAFIDLWHSRMSIISDAVRSSGKICYTPLSAGLDSRLIAYELDCNGLPQINLTFGAGAASREINVAAQVSRSLKHALGHYVMYLNEANFKHIIQNSPITYRLTTAHFAEKDLWFPAHYRDECGFFFSGHSGDFMAGSHLRTRMKFWKEVEPVIEYIVKYKGTPLGRYLYFNNQKYKELIFDSLSNCLSGYPDLLNAFMNWDLEQRQRRFIMRSALSQTPDRLPLVVMPFFDYELFDFFVDLPFEFLLDTKLYRHAQMDHLYKNVKPFDRLKANGRKVKPFIGGTLGEYGYKVLSLFDKGKKNIMYADDIDWKRIAGDFEFPEILDSKWIVPQFLKDNSRMYYGISEFNKEYKLLQKNVN